MRRYYHARAVGRPDAVLEKISRIVLDAGQASRIPIVKLERNAYREFYVFLGVDDDLSYGIPGGLGKVLYRVGIRFEENFALNPEQISTMVQRQDIEIHAFNSLTYRPWLYNDPGDPLAALNETDAEGEVLGSWESHERLLHWISARGDGTWEQFKNACEIVGVVNERFVARAALRRFRLLCHIDLSPDGTKWSVSPTAFVRYEDDRSKGFLVGQRTEAMIRDVTTLCTNVDESHSGPAGPKLIEIDTPNAEELAELGIVDAGAAAHRLAKALPDLNHWKATLATISNLDLGRMAIERWENGNFQECDTIYIRDGMYFGQSGMYRLGPHDERSRRSIIAFFDQALQKWFKGDWYGLRFLHNVAELGNAEAVHNLGAGSLLIPVAERWPLLYEQALTLTSGLLPIPSGNRNWLEYRRVPIDIAKTLCKKLNVALREE